MAIKAGIFVTSCAKVWLDALIDEATSCQFDRTKDAFEVKLRAYPADEMPAVFGGLNKSMRQPATNIQPVKYKVPAA